MRNKSKYLQIRVTPEQKEALKQAAARAGQSLSSFVLARVLPDERARYDELLQALVQEEEPGYVLAELNELLDRIGPTELPEITTEPPPAELSDYLQNYVAAMVEHAAHQKGARPPEWVTRIEPLQEPRFAARKPGLRLYLLAAAPVAFRRRNIFVDSTVGDRV